MKKTDELTQEEKQLLEVSRQRKAKIAKVEEEINKVLTENNAALTIDPDSPYRQLRILVTLL